MPATPNPPLGTQVPSNFFAQYAVMASYGHAMLAVQAFERTLAVALMIAELTEAVARRDPDKRLAPKAVDRRLRVIGKRILHTFNTASASELRNCLRGRLDQGLIDEIDPLIEWRDFLAHRYLIARVGQFGSALKPHQDHIHELADLAEAFQQMTLCVKEACDATVAAMVLARRTESNPAAAEAFRQAVTASSEALANQQPPRFRP
jgi:hypothetical protein